MEISSELAVEKERIWSLEQRVSTCLDHPLAEEQERPESLLQSVLLGRRAQFRKLPPKICVHQDLSVARGRRNFVRAILPGLAKTSH